MTQTRDLYALIGAGPMGLAAARNLQKHGIPFEGFESHSDVGGLWDIDNPHSTVYKSAHLISSKRMTEFREFPMPDEAPDYPSHRHLRRYFRAYADHFDLRQHFRFDSRVIRTERGNSGWRLTFESGGKTETRDYRGLLIANGTLSEPNLPISTVRFRRPDPPLQPLQITGSLRW